ncbi:hypothetical protein [Phenylobacterium sp.]|uniref:hypothetical protein n=1 Tax=Phenylobacterium sp. TaxID=1871053 RepID=UPI0039C95138
MTRDGGCRYGAASADVYGNLGDDTCNGGEGADTIRGGQANDILQGGEWNDWLSGDRGDDTVTAGAGGRPFSTPSATPELTG